MSTLRTVSFVIPVRNDAARLARCLASISSNRMPAPDVQVIVADNGSTDASAQVAANAGAQVLVLPSLSVARLRNEAAKLATGDVLAFVDADHEIAPDWIAAALEGLNATGAAGIGALCHAPMPATWVQRAYDRLRRRSSEATEVEWLGAGNLAVTADAFRAVGGFDTTLETCEDVDLCNRLRAHGGRLMNEPRMYNVHFGDPATLRSLFLGELWRGRDNLRVTLRGPLTLRALPSVLIPIAVVGAPVAGTALATWSGRGAWLWLPALAFGAATVLRMTRMSRTGVTGFWRGLAENGMVAAVYESARALALVMTASHKVRRTA